MDNRIDVSSKAYENVSEGHGKEGHIKKASFFGRSIEVTLPGSDVSIKLNRGSLIDYLESYEQGKITRGGVFGLIFKGTSDEELQQMFDDTVLRTHQFFEHGEILGITAKCTTEGDSSEVRLLPGMHDMQMLHGEKKGEIVKLRIKHPIVELSKPGEIRLIMHKDDFELIQRTIHQGAFGNRDHGYIYKENGLVEIKKIPADLSFIKDWKIPHEKMVGVGEELIAKDNGQGQVFKKFRNDIRDLDSTNGCGVITVHHLELIPESSSLESEPKINAAAFSLGNICENFDDTADAGRGRIPQLHAALNDLGITFFESTHSLAFYTSDTNETLSPQKLAAMLQEDDGGKIKAALKEASKQNFDVDKWANRYIQVYGKQQV